MRATIYWGHHKNHRRFLNGSLHSSSPALGTPTRKEMVTVGKKDKYVGGPQATAGAVTLRCSVGRFHSSGFHIARAAVGGEVDKIRGRQIPKPGPAVTKGWCLVPK